MYCEGIPFRDAVRKIDEGQRLFGRLHAHGEDDLGWLRRRSGATVKQPGKLPKKMGGISGLIGWSSAAFDKGCRFLDGQLYRVLEVFRQLPIGDLDRP